MVIAASMAFGVGGAFMKASDGFSRMFPSICLLVLFVIGAVFLTLAVRSLGLSAAYVLGLGIEVLVSVGLGRYLYDEQLTPSQVVGAVLIVAGVATVRYG
ncbi:MAG: SMR family transporter [Ilumatobacteraceae bacterium]